MQIQMAQTTLGRPKLMPRANFGFLGGVGFFFLSLSFLSDTLLRCHLEVRLVVFAVGGSRAGTVAHGAEAEQFVLAIV